MARLSAPREFRTGPPNFYSGVLSILYPFEALQAFDLHSH